MRELENALVSDLKWLFVLEVFGFWKFIEWASYETNISRLSPLKMSHNMSKEASIGSVSNFRENVAFRKIISNVFACTIKINFVKSILRIIAMF